MTELESKRERLRHNFVLNNNYVYAIGYALEKVHGGVLQAILLSDDGPILAADLWTRCHGEANFTQDAISNVRVKREEKITKAGTIDMVVTFRVGNQDRFILCEYKVDGTKEHDQQCRSFKAEWDHRHFGHQTRYAFFTAGASRFWDPPSDFTHLDIPDLIAMLEPLQPHYPHLLPAYLTALHDDLIRGEIAVQVANTNSDERACHGYRGFDWWYAYYHALKQEFVLPRDWEMYSGGRNPVLNWKPAFTKDTLGGKNVCRFGRLFCEFNKSTFLLKVAWNPENPSNDKVAELYDLVNASGMIEEFGLTHAGRRCTAHKYSSFAKKDFADPMNTKSMSDWVNKSIQKDFSAVCAKMATP